MIQINLLPWREKAREIKKKKFAFLSSIFFFLFLMIAISWHLLVRQELMVQSRLNQYLESEIQQQESHHQAFNEQTKNKIALENQMRYIIGLLQRGYDSVRILNEIHHQVPDSIVLTSIYKMNNIINLQGNAAQDSDITLFKKNIQNSKMFEKPNLIISSNEKGTARHFEIRVDLKGGA